MICTYCGDAAETLDHLIPVSFQTNERNLSGSARHRAALGPTVPCCSDCNNMLGNKMVHTIHGRANVCARGMRRRFKKVLLSPRWDAEDLAELGPNLRSSVVAGEGMRKLVEARIWFAERVVRQRL